MFLRVWTRKWGKATAKTGLKRMSLSIIIAKSKLSSLCYTLDVLFRWIDISSLQDLFRSLHVHCKCFIYILVQRFNIMTYIITHISVMSPGGSGGGEDVPTITEWLVAHLASVNGTVGADPFLISSGIWNIFITLYVHKKGILKPTGYYW